MNFKPTLAVSKLPIGVAIVALIITACGGGSAVESAAAPQSNTGTVGLLFTDAPTDEFEAILLNVTEAVLIGGDEKQHFLFQGSEPIDLLQSEGFDILPGRTILIEIDMDANNSIKATSAGNSGKYQFRPVVKVKILDEGLPHKLARLEGSVSAISADSSGRFTLCDIDSPDHCVMVATDGDTGIFDNVGLDTAFGTLVVGDMVVAIGSYITDPEIALNAVVLEIGGNAEQVKGNVVSNPMDDQFLVVVDDDGNLVVELQAGTQYYNADGTIGAEAIVLGVDVEVEGVKPPKADAVDPDLMRAALIFLEADADEQISGTITEPLAAETRSFVLTLTEGGSTCVRVNEDADIILVDEANSIVTMGTFADLAVDQAVELFGEEDLEDQNHCFDANEVIVEANTP